MEGADRQTNVLTIRNGISKLSMGLSLILFQAFNYIHTFLRKQHRQSIFCADFEYLKQGMYFEHNALAIDDNMKIGMIEEKKPSFKLRRK